MKVDNPVTRDFLLNHPADAARVLEPVTPAHVAALFEALPPPTLAPVVSCMLPAAAADCLQAMTPAAAARLLAEMPVVPAAGLYRLLGHDSRRTIAALLPDRHRRRMLRHLDYPQSSVGSMVDPEIIMLTESITVAEAIRRVGDSDSPASCDVYIVDDAHRYVGVTDVGELLRANQHARLGEVANRRITPLAARATATAVLANPRWSTARSLPVVERDNTLIGVLRYRALQEATMEMEPGAGPDPLDNLISLAGLYWLSVAQLLDGMLGLRGSERGGRQ